MSATADIHITLDLQDAESLALAQFVKRVTWSAMRECAVDDDECYQLRTAIDKLRSALAEAGYSPR